MRNDAGARPRLLVVDDEAAILEEIVGYVTARGAEVATAGEATAALAQLAADPAVTVLLTDLRMPGPDGLTLIERALAGRDEANALEAVVLTGHASIEDAMAAVRRRAFDFVRKPVRLAELWEILQRAHASAHRRRVQAREAREATERLRETAERVGREVLATLGHEFRSPLVPILGLAEVLETAPATLGPEEVAEYGRLIRRAGERLSELSELGLTLSALEAGTAPRTATRTLAAEVLEQVARSQEQEARARGLRLERDCTAEAPLMVDRRFLTAALTQLLSNAVHAAPPGTAVRMRAWMARHGVAFSVEASGPGMTTEQMAVALQPFRRLEMPPARRHDGLGIGLTLASRLAQAIGSELVLESVPGRGTSVRMTVPLHPPPAAPP